MKNKGLIVTLLVAIELLLCGGIVGIGWIIVSQPGFRLHIPEFDAISAEANAEQRFTVGDSATLDVENANGQVNVRGTPGNTIVVQTHKEAWGSSLADAQAELADLQVNIAQNGNTVTVRHPQQESHGIGFIDSAHFPTIDLTITVPITTAVIMRTSFGDTSLTGTAGNIDLQTNNGTMRVTDVSGNLKLRSAFGGITVARAAIGELDVRSNNGAIDLTDVNADGTVTLNNSFGAIEFKDGRAASLDVQTNNGQVMLTNLKVLKGITARTSFGPLSLVQVQAATFDLRATNDDISVDGASGTLQAQTSFGNVDVKNGSQVNLDLASTNGSLSFSGSLGDGTNKLATQFGNVRLSLPKDSKLSFDFKTNIGQFQSKLPVILDSAANNKHWSGTLNDGGTRLTINTTNGNIYLDTLNP